MKCKDAMEQYMALDENKIIPLKVTLHIIRCSKCRSLVRSMTIAKNISKRNLHINTEYNNEFIKETMKKIDNIVPELMRIQSEKNKLPKVRILPWVIMGFVMILGLTSIPFTATGKWASESFQLQFIIPIALVSATLISVYLALFVIRNLDFFIKKFDLI